MCQGLQVSGNLKMASMARESSEPAQEGPGRQGRGREGCGQRETAGLFGGRGRDAKAGSESCAGCSVQRWWWSRRQGWRAAGGPRAWGDRGRWVQSALCKAEGGCPIVPPHHRHHAANSGATTASSLGRS